MSLFCLVPHRSSGRSATTVEVTVERSGSDTLLRYALSNFKDIVWPGSLKPGRADGLWRTTCFELFLQFDDDERYVEFNFSPSTQWAAYAFEGYRDGMEALDLGVPPRIERLPDGLAVMLDLSGLPRGEHRMGLSAVIEEVDGTKSYWALAHAPGPPDFHHPACFAARLPAPGAP